MLNQPIKQQPGKQLRGSQSLSDSIICYIDHSITTATSCSGRLNFWKRLSFYLEIFQYSLLSLEVYFIFLNRFKTVWKWTTIFF